MNAANRYDVIIIGTGAGGGTLARVLAPSGKRVLLLERGTWLPREIQNWTTADVFVDNRYISADTWRDKGGKTFQPQVHYFVGGATKFYGAALYRLRREDFGELRHHDGISPAWPIGYEDMQPYYDRAEKLYQVHGVRGEDPTDPAGAPYPFPPVSHEPRIQRLSDDLARAGYHPFHAPCGIMLDEGNMPFSTCIRCATCDGFPCLVHAKADAEVVGVRPALEYPNVTLITGAEATKLWTDVAGTSVTEVEVAMDDGRRETFAGDIVVVSCGAANSARLLLASANDRHPNGLANGSDQVGRNYMFHNSQAVLALSTDPNPTVFQKTLAVNDFYFRGPDFEYPMGNIQMLGKSQAEMFRGERPGETRLAPTWSLRDIAHHAVDFWLSTEDLPRPDNRVTVERDGSVRLSYEPSNDVPASRLYAQMKSMLGHLGMHPDHLIPRHAYLKTAIPIAGVAHQAGTCRFGTDPATSALNVDCRAHEVDNLYVVDTSFFPSIGAVNPALTAAANAIRVGDHLLDRLHASAPAEPELAVATR
jgi:choline dehydrogenase-like flavoprotein